MAMSVLTLALAVVAGSILYQYIITPAFLSPLSRIPAGHWSAHISTLWLLWLRWAGQENQTVFELHQKYGKAVRLAPSTLSLNCYEGGLKQIYLGGFPKSDFYFNRFAHNGQSHNIFTLQDNAAHSVRRRILSHTFSKSYVAKSPTARATICEILFRRLLPIIDHYASQGKPVEMLEINYSYAMDTFVHWQFGRSAGSDLVRNEQERRGVLDVFLGIAPYNFWLNELPQFCRGISKLRVHLIPTSLFAGFRRIDQWNSQRCDKAQRIITTRCSLRQQVMKEDHEDYPVVFAQAYKSMASSDPQRQTGSEKQGYHTRTELAADMLMLDGAAFETTGATLTYTLFELSRNSEVQEKLRQELRTLHPILSYTEKGTATDLPLAIDVDALPYLDSVLMETLRLYPSVPGRQPRVVPKSCSLGGYDSIPAGTTVHCSAYSLHRTPEVFPEPLAWRPGRWLEASPEQLREMRRWFWAFGSGGRMCIGINFAIYSMKYLIGVIYSNYRTTIYDHGDMEQQDGYIAGLKGQRLELIFERC
ncbi:cytochrome P450 [Aspergillus recurvatus]